MMLARLLGVDHELSEDELRAAAGGDLNVLAVLMIIGSTTFAGINMWIGTMGWIAAALAVSSTLVWSSGLLRRSPPIGAFVKIGFGFSGLAAPAIGIVGLIVGIVGYRWGWAVLGGAVVYFFFSLLGLEIIERAENTGALDRFEL